MRGIFLKSFRSDIIIYCTALLINYVIDLSEFSIKTTDSTLYFITYFILIVQKNIRKGKWISKIRKREFLVT